MVMERAELTSKPGEEEAFAAALKDKAIPILTDVPGVLSIQHGRGIESPSKFLLLVGWESLDAHTAFKGSPVYGQFMGAFGAHVAGGAAEHFEVN